MAKKKAPTKGRKAGVPNLSRDGNYITNQYGVQITEDEHRRLINAARRVNRKREKMIQEWKGKPLFEGTTRLPEDREQLRLMGEEMDLMIRKRSSGLQQFHSRKEFTAYLRNAEKAAEVDYLDWRGKLYKQNLKTAIERNFGQFPDLTAGVLMKLQMMPQNKFQELIGSNRAFQIKFMYSTGDQLEALMRMREALGLSSNYDDWDGEID